MKSIMLIDDEPLVLSMLKQMLKREGYDIVTAEHGKEALNLLQQMDTHPDLIVTDLIMPFMKGLDMIPQIKANYPDIKIIAFSGGLKHIDPDTQVDESISLGADKCIAKPVERQVMLDAVRELLEE